MNFTTILFSLGFIAYSSAVGKKQESQLEKLIDDVKAIKLENARLHKENKNLNSLIEEKYNKMNARISNVETLVNSGVSKRSENTLGFTAFVTQDTSTAANQPVIFNGAFSNYGEGYSTDTGIFTCITHGVYLFSISVVTPPDYWVNLQIVKNSKGELFYYSQAYGSEVYFDSGSGFSIIECDVDDQVYVMSWENSVVSAHPGNNSPGYSTFSGLLLEILS